MSPLAVPCRRPVCGHDISNHDQQGGPCLICNCTRFITSNSAVCHQIGCGHDVRDHDPHSAPHTCLTCGCPGFALSGPKPEPEPEPATEPALEAAASHLAGLGRGKYHRIDVTTSPVGASGRILLDGVELRGVTAYSIDSSVDKATRITLTLIVSVGIDNDPPGPRSKPKS